MSRTLSSAARHGVFAQETGEVYLVILEIDHTDLSVPIRVVNNTEDVVSNGDTYLAFPFNVALPPDTDQGVVSVTLTIDNVDRQIVDALRDVTSPPIVSISVLLASSPNTIEAGPYNMTVGDADYDALSVNFQLTFEDILNEPFPALRFNPPQYPGLF